MNNTGQPFVGGVATDFTISIPASGGTVGARYRDMMPTGIVGIATNGVPIASAWERAEVPLDQSSVSFDTNGGHSFSTLQYHYHKDLRALYDSGSPSTSSAGAHSGLVGWLNDGWAIYGRFESGSDLPTDLDECNGHWGPVPDGKGGVVVTYHYHTSAWFPFLAGCYGEAIKPAACTLEPGSTVCAEKMLPVYPRAPETCSATDGTSPACPASGSRGRPAATDGTADCVGQVDFVADSGAITSTLVDGVCTNSAAACNPDTHTFVGTLCGEYRGSGSCGCCIPGAIGKDQGMQGPPKECTEGQNPCPDGKMPTDRKCGDGTAPACRPPKGGGGGGRIRRVGAPRASSQRPTEEEAPSNQVFSFEGVEARRTRRQKKGSGGGGKPTPCSDTATAPTSMCDTYSCRELDNIRVAAAADTRCPYLGCDEATCCAPTTVFGPNANQTSKLTTTPRTTTAALTPAPTSTSKPNATQPPTRADGTDSASAAATCGQSQSQRCHGVVLAAVLVALQLGGAC